MSLTILSVAYPFAPVAPETAGGAEQVLLQLDRAITDAGMRSIVVASEGSRVTGRLVAVPAVGGILTPEVREAAQARHRLAIRSVLAKGGVDLMHLHGVDASTYLPADGPPALVTLHLPPDWYPEELFRSPRPDTWLNPVSRTQAERCPPSPQLLAPVANGVPVDALQARHSRRGFALCLGRICPEKGTHLAIEAARAAGVPLLLAGEVFPYPEHRRYMREEVLPRLGPGIRWLGPVGFARKRRLLTAARCVLLPVLAEETSSLVAREAAACGTPVIAFRRGALPETVEEGRTGFLVDSGEEMAAAIARTGEIDAETCRAVARRRFSLERMTGAYLDLYRSLARQRASAARLATAAGGRA